MILHSKMEPILVQSSKYYVSPICFQKNVHIQEEKKISKAGSRTLNLQFPILTKIDALMMLHFQLAMFRRWTSVPHLTFNTLLQALLNSKNFQKIIKILPNIICYSSIKIVSRNTQKVIISGGKPLGINKKKRPGHRHLSEIHTSFIPPPRQPASVSEEFN